MRAGKTTSTGRDLHWLHCDHEQHDIGPTGTWYEYLVPVLVLVQILTSSQI
jgi:hypothetical protein